MTGSMRTAFLSVHRWASIAVAIFWLLQAISGMLIVFHWEIDDLTVPGAHRPSDFAAIERTVAAVAPPGSGAEIGSMWTTGGKADRYDLFVASDDPTQARTVRIDGAGNILRERLDTVQWGQGAWRGKLVGFHHNLLGGDIGSWIVGLSGLVLLSNIIGGVVLAWPRRRAWRQALAVPSRKGGKPARFYGWHRTLGLWVAIPAFLLVLAGTMMVFSNAVSGVVKPEPNSIDARPWPAGASLATSRVGLPQAVATTLARYPGGEVSGISFPSADNSLWQVRVRQPVELAKTYGQTVVYVDAVGGGIVADFDGMKVTAGRGLMNALFAIHVGEAAGTVGRILVLLIGAWLVTMVVVGIRLWLARRRPAKS